MKLGAIRLLNTELPGGGPEWDRATLGRRQLMTIDTWKQIARLEHDTMAGNDDPFEREGKHLREEKYWAGNKARLAKDAEELI